LVGAIVFVGFGVGLAVWEAVGKGELLFSDPAATSPEADISSGLVPPVHAANRRQKITIKTLEIIRQIIQQAGEVARSKVTR
jgi:hypothetical protein